MGKIKIVKIKTIYNEEFTTKCLFINEKLNFIDTEHGRIPKNEIKEFSIIGEI